MSIRLGIGRKAVASTGALAALGVLAAGAAAHIGGPGTGLPIDTIGPDLRSVTILAYDVDSADGPRAKFCFDKEVSSVGAPGNYVIFGYDSNRFFKPATVAKSSELTCVIATFADHTDINQGTVGSTTPGAVADVNGKGSDYGSEPVTGSVVSKRAGASTGPDLVSAKVDPDRPTNARTVTYTFDEPIPAVGKKRQMTPNPNDGAATEVVNQAYAAGDFLYRNTAGDPIAGTSVTSVSGASVTVNFGTEPGLDSATRLIANGGAVQDRPETGSSGGRETWTDSAFGVITPAGAGISNPEAASAAPTGAQTYAITFTKPIAVTAATKNRVVAIADDGSAVTAATDATVSGSTLNVVFPAAAAADPDSIVGIGLLAGAVNDPNTANNPSVVGEVPLTPVSPGFSQPGFTSGPDLISVGVDTATRRVTYNYDEPVLVSSAMAADFRAVTSDGAAALGSGGVVAGTTSGAVVVSYGADADAAVGYTNAFAKVADPTGRPNPIQSVSRFIEPAPTTPGTTPPGTTPPGTTTPGPGTTPPGGSTRKKITVKKVSFKISGSSYTGTVSADSPCKSRRTVSLKRTVGKKSKTIAKTTTNSSGKFTFKRTSKTKGKKSVYVVVGQKLTSTVNCASKTSSKTKG